jgi:predicted dehydrogenase
MARSVPDLHAVDVVTDPSLHHEIVCGALDLRLHVLVEKPMGITVGACHRMVEAAQRNNRKLSVAENYRRDPSAHLARHLLDRGAIGKPYMALFHHISGGRDIFITPWRHLKDRGGPLVDLGVHFADLIRYQLGEVDEVCGDYAFYRNRHENMPLEVPADAEDTSVAILKMASGATVNWVVGLGGHGNCSGELILGTEGSLRGFGTRGGRVALRSASGEEQNQEQILEAEREFELDPLTAHFFPKGISVGDGSVDWKLIAIELHELAEAVLRDRPVEVDGGEGLKDVAAVYAILEAARAGRPVKVAEVETCQVYDYQSEIDEALGIA